jgi:hypothetical protein
VLHPALKPSCWQAIAPSAYGSQQGYFPHPLQISKPWHLQHFKPAILLKPDAVLPAPQQLDVPAAWKALKLAT